MGDVALAREHPEPQLGLGLRMPKCLELGPFHCLLLLLTWNPKAEDTAGTENTAHDGIRGFSPEFYLPPYRETIGEIYRMIDSSLQNISPALMHSGVLTVEREEFTSLLNQLVTSFCRFKFVIRDIKNRGFFN